MILRTRKLNVLLAIVFVISWMVSSAHAQTGKKPAAKKPATAVKLYSVRAGTKMRVRMEETINSKTSTVGTTFSTKVVEPVYSTGGVVVIPVGSEIKGKVVSVQKAVKGGKPGTIDVAFTSVVLPNGRRTLINGTLTSLDKDGTTSDNEGQVSAKKTSNRKLKFIGGGTGGGVLIGALAGGGKGALIGGLIGAGGGFLTERYTKGKDAEVKDGTEFGVYLNRSISLPAYK